jgi:ATP-dependent exoDNAse (exonuclease V) beta subunit
LRSPMFGLSDDKIAEWFLPLEGQPGLHDALVAEAARDPAGRASEVHALLSRWKLLRETLPPSLLLRQALDETGAWGAFAADGRGGRAVANVEKLLDRVRELPAQGIVGLAAIREHLEEVAAVERDEPEAGIELARDAINIMTVHGAKGLEFPIVIVPGLQRRWPVPGGPLLVGPRGEVAIASGDGEDGASGEEEPAPSSRTGPSAPRISDYERVKDALARDAEMEARRLLYVALTRPRDRLLVTCVARRTPSGAPASRAQEPWRRWLHAAIAIEDLPTQRSVTPEGWQLRRIPLTPPEPPSVASSGVNDPSERHLALAESLLDPHRSGSAPPALGWELVPAQPPARGGGRLSFSVSELETMRECERCWWEHVPYPKDLGGARDPTPAEAALEALPPVALGELVHDLLSRGPPVQLPYLRSRLTLLLPRVDEDDLDRLATILTDHLRWTFSQDGVTSGGPALREEPMIWAGERSVVRGRIDAAFPRGAAPTVQDYKTGASVPFDPSELRALYGFQLSCYALAVRRGARSVQARIVDPINRGLWSWEISPKELQGVAEELTRLTDRGRILWEGKDVPRGCGRASCPACGRDAGAGVETPTA